MRKHQLFPRTITEPPSPRLGLVVIIPCHDEPELIATLEALRRCRQPPCAVEVIVVINASEADESAVHARNRETWVQVKGWIANNAKKSRRRGLVFHVLDFPALPRRHAGVGLARKLGMDEAVARFGDAGNPCGLIACLDADCACDPNYLQAIVAHFQAHPETPGCSIYFEHPVDGAYPRHLAPDRRIEDGILRYELFLRYYTHGLRYSGFPYAYYTVGSCMAVRCHVYEKQGGMNRRKAGEDFYFLHKVIPLGAFTEIRDTRVIPSARVSGRVPFGTGRAMKDWLERDSMCFPTYAPAVFRDLRALFSQASCLYRADPLGRQFLDDLPVPLARFLRAHGFEAGLAEIQGNASSLVTFEKRFYQWFNALRVLKFVNWATETAYPRVPLERAATTLLRWRCLVDEGQGGALDAKRLLNHYRHMDRTGRFIAFNPRAESPPVESGH